MRLRKHTASLLLTVALLCATLVLASCGTSTASASSSSWAQYHDKIYPFQIPIPSGWHVYVQTNANCDHTVDVLPPGATVPVGPIGAERIAVRVVSGCPEWRGTLDDSAEVQTGRITICGVPAVVYDNNSDPGWTNRTAVANFGGHQYLFNVQAPPNKAQQDVGLFAHVLQGFRYQ